MARVYGLKLIPHRPGDADQPAPGRRYITAKDIRPEAPALCLHCGTRLDPADAPEERWEPHTHCRKIECRAADRRERARPSDP